MRLLTGLVGVRFSLRRKLCLIHVLFFISPHQPEHFLALGEVLTVHTFTRYCPMGLAFLVFLRGIFFPPDLVMSACLGVTTYWTLQSEIENFILLHHYSSKQILCGIVLSCPWIK